MPSAAAAARRVTYDRDILAAVAGEGDGENMRLPLPSPRVMSGVSCSALVLGASLSLSVSLGLVLDDGREDAGLRDSLRSNVVCKRYDVVCKRCGDRNKRSNKTKRHRDENERALSWWSVPIHLTCGPQDRSLTRPNKQYDLPPAYNASLVACRFDLLHNGG